MKKRTTKPILEACEVVPGYPERPSPGLNNPARRRFLRQIGLGAGVLSAVGPVASVRGQEGVEADFSILADHDPLTDDRSQAVSVQRGRRSAASDSPSEPTALPTEAVITENRAVWVEPAYLILLQWHRPENADGAVAALDGSAEAIRAFMAEQVGDAFSELHDPESLQNLERGLLTLLTPLLVPAEIEVLHIDHDCGAVCHVPVDPPVMLRGRVAPPHIR